MSQTSTSEPSEATTRRSHSVSWPRWAFLACVTLAIGYWCFREPAARPIPGTITTRDSGVQEGVINLGLDPQLGPFELRLSAAEFAFLWNGHTYPAPRVFSTRFTGPYAVNRLSNGRALALIGDEAVVLQPDGRSATYSLLLPNGSTGSAAALDTFVDGQRLTVLLRSKGKSGAQCDLVAYDLPTDNAALSANLQPVDVTPIPSDLSAAFFLDSTHNWVGIERLSRNQFEDTENVAHLLRADGETLKLPVGFSQLTRLGKTSGGRREPPPEPLVAIAKRSTGYELAQLNIDGPLRLDERRVVIDLASDWPPDVLSHSPNGRWCLIKAVNYRVEPIVGFPRRYRKERLILVDVANWSIAARCDYEDSSFKPVGLSHFVSARFSEDSKQVEVATSDGKIATVDVESWVDSQ